MLQVCPALRADGPPGPRHQRRRHHAGDTHNALLCSRRLPLVFSLPFACVWFRYLSFAKAFLCGCWVLQIHKSFGIPSLCCMRPEVMVFDADGGKIGSIEDPYACCVMNQKIFDIDGNQIYGVSGSVCQKGVMPPPPARPCLSLRSAGQVVFRQSFSLR